MANPYPGWNPGYVPFQNFHDNLADRHNMIDMRTEVLTLMAAIQIAEETDQLFSSTQSSGRGGRGVRGGGGRGQQQGGRIAAMPGGGRGNGRGYGGRGNGQQQQQQRPPKLCYNGKEEGHFKDQCPNPPAQQK